jgi:hypothetical protein
MAEHVKRKEGEKPSMASHLSWIHRTPVKKQYSIRLCGHQQRHALRSPKGNKENAELKSDFIFSWPAERALAPFLAAS